jgi:hypothetical protein
MKTIEPCNFVGLYFFVADLYLTMSSRTIVRDLYMNSLAI